MSGRSTLISGLLQQTAVYWAAGTNDGYGGRTFPDPSEVAVRWEDRQEVFVDAQGRESVSKSVVYSASALVVGGYLYLGSLDDLDSSEEADPLSVGAAYEIMSRASSPSLKADLLLRKHWLSR